MGTKLRDHRTGRSQVAIDAHFRQAGAIGERSRKGKGRVKGDTSTRQQRKSSLRRDAFIDW